MLIIILPGDELSKVMNLADELSKDKDYDYKCTRLLNKG